MIQEHTSSRISFFVNQVLYSLGSAMKELRPGMISGRLPSMNCLKPWREYLFPSSKFSRTPAALFSLVTLLGSFHGMSSEQIQKKFRRYKST
jgi:hypothetical protein